MPRTDIHRNRRIQGQSVAPLATREDEMCANRRLEGKDRLLVNGENSQRCGGDGHSRRAGLLFKNTLGRQYLERSHSVKGDVAERLSIG